MVVSIDFWLPCDTTRFMRLVAANGATSRSKDANTTKQSISRITSPRRVGSYSSLLHAVDWSLEDRRMTMLHKKKTHEKVTLKTIAQHLGLTPGTVSAALNNSKAARSIPDYTKQRILEAARASDVVPLRSTSKLRD